MKQHSKPLVFDATPLIYLAKAEILGKIRVFDSENIMLESVYKEVVERGKLKGENDATYIQKLIEQNVFKRKGFSEKTSFQENKNLSNTDREVLTFSKQKNAMIIADDEEMRIVADLEGIEVHGSIYILFRLLSEKNIDKHELKNALDRMINNGWYCSIDFYNEIVGAMSK